MEKKNKKEAECPCKEDLLNATQTMVETVEGYTEKDHREKKKEVTEAFGKKENTVYTRSEIEFLQETQDLVDAVEGYGRKDHIEKKKEVKDAFQKK